MIRSIRRKVWLTLAVVGLVASACGGDDSSTASATTDDLQDATEAVETTVDTEPATGAEAEPDETADAEPAEDTEAGDSDDTTSDEPDDVETATPQPEFPIEFFGRTLGLDGFDELEGGQLVNISGPLLSTAGEPAEMAFSLPDLRVEGGSTECGGEVHEGPFTTETDFVTTGTISLEPWGTLDVEFTHTSTVYNSELSPPFCDEQTGAWTGSDGELEGSTGTIHRLRMGDTERITLNF